MHIVRQLGLWIALLLGGCVTNEPTYLADGSKGHLISCSPAFSYGLVGSVAAASTNWGTCYQKAGEVCGARGFDILEKSGETGSTFIADRYAAAGGTTQNRMMIVKCKG
jgi:hypothetical protein